MCAVINETTKTIRIENVVTKIVERIVKKEIVTEVPVEKIVTRVETRYVQTGKEVDIQEIVEYVIARIKEYVPSTDIIDVPTEVIVDETTDYITNPPPPNQDKEETTLGGIRDETPTPIPIPLPDEDKDNDGTADPNSEGDGTDDGSNNGGSEDGGTDDGSNNGGSEDDETDDGSNDGGSEDDATDDGSNNGGSEDDKTDDGSNDGGSEDDATNNGSNNGGSEDDETDDGTNNGGSENGDPNGGSNDGGSENNGTDDGSNDGGSEDDRTNGNTNDGGSEDGTPPRSIPPESDPNGGSNNGGSKDDKTDDGSNDGGSEDDRTNGNTNDGGSEDGTPPRSIPPESDPNGGSNNGGSKDDKTDDGSNDGGSEDDRTNGNTNDGGSEDGTPPRSIPPESDPNGGSNGGGSKDDKTDDGSNDGGSEDDRTNGNTNDGGSEDGTPPRSIPPESDPNGGSNGGGSKDDKTDDGSNDGGSEDDRTNGNTNDGGSEDGTPPRSIPPESDPNGGSNNGGSENGDPNGGSENDGTDEDSNNGGPEGGITPENLLGPDNTDGGPTEGVSTQRLQVTIGPKKVTTRPSLIQPGLDIWVTCQVDGNTIHPSINSYSLFKGDNSKQWGIEAWCEVPSNANDSDVTIHVNVSNTERWCGLTTADVSVSRFFPRGDGSSYGGESVSAVINLSPDPVPVCNIAPMFTEGGSTTRSIFEGAELGSTVGLPVSATDANDDTLEYNLSGTDADSFSIDSTTGQLKTSVLLDYETKSSYSVTVSVSDSNGETDTITVTINVTDVDENRAPMFTDGGSTTRSVEENTTSGTAIGDTVSATDEDGDTLEYNLSGTDAASFSINSSSGQLRTSAPLDYETKSLYSVTVSVSDGNGGTDTITVTINVTDANDAPMFTEAAPTSRSIAENTAPGVDIGDTVSATDADDGDTLTYTLGGTDAASFSINSSSGQLRTSAPLDYETKDSYSVLVTVDDSNGGTDEITVAISVTDANDAPMFTEAAPTSRSIAENTAPGVDIGDTVSATDEDGDTLTYTLGGTDAVSFSIDSSSGQLRTSAPLDYETEDSYSVLVTVDDSNGGTDEITVTISVTDANDAPMFTEAAPTSRSIAENTAPGVDIGDTVSATDADDDMLEYTLGGTDASSFTIVDTTGQLRTSAPLDYETKDSYSVLVTVDDSNGGTDEITVTISVTDANDAPMFTEAAPTSRSIAENTASGVDIGDTVSATDEDGDTLTYTLGGTDAASFSINSSSGQLRTSAPLDYETKDSYSVLVTVDDSNGGTDEITVTISVDDVDENRAPMFTEGVSANRRILEDAASGTDIGDPVSATDEDNDMLEYTLGGTDASSFSIHSSSGQLSTNTTLDYDIQSSYSVTVSVSDGNGGTDEIAITILVLEGYISKQEFFEVYYAILLEDDFLEVQCYTIRGYGYDDGEPVYVDNYYKFEDGTPGQTSGEDTVIADLENTWAEDYPEAFDYVHGHITVSIDADTTADEARKMIYQTVCGAAAAIGTWEDGYQVGLTYPEGIDNNTSNDVLDLNTILSYLGDDDCNPDN